MLLLSDNDTGKLPLSPLTAILFAMLHPPLLPESPGINMYCFANDRTDIDLHLFISECITMINLHIRKNSRIH